jgi:hypothetical protein
MSLFSRKQPSAISALASYAMPVRTLEEELKTLIGRFGSDVVRENTLALTKKKRGRKQEKDWPIIGPRIIRLDAIDWLDGRDPFQIRSNFSIAVEFTKEYPGHNSQSTHRRIMGKLAKKRQLLFMMTALELSERERPYADYFRAFAAFPFSKGLELGKHYQSVHNRHVGAIENYRTQFGEPDPSLTLLAIELALQQSLMEKASPKPFVGLSDLLGQHPKQ